MNTPKWIGITIAVVASEAPLLAGYVVHETGSTEGLLMIGRLVAAIINGFVC